MEVKEWLNFDITKTVIKKIYDIRSHEMEAVLISGNKDLACGVVIGVTNVVNFIENLEEGDL